MVFIVKTEDTRGGLFPGNGKAHKCSCECRDREEHARSATDGMICVCDHHSSSPTGEWKTSLCPDSYNMAGRGGVPPFCRHTGDLTFVIPIL
jgi:hypothetical protein